MSDFKKNLLLIITGSVTGIINGFFGGGGGMVVVPLLALLSGLEPKKAHATAIAVILPVCVVSGLTYVFNKTFDLRTGAWVTLGFVVGGAVGALILKKIKSVWIAKIFAFVMLAAGVKLLFF